MLNRPRALLLDEPTASLDPDNRSVVEAMIREHCADGTPVLVVTHEATQAKRLGARRMVLEEGGLLREAAP